MRPIASWCSSSRVTRRRRSSRTLPVTATIDATGVVVKVEARATLTHEPVVACFKANVMRLRFPAKGKTTVRGKITFAAG
jgi:hypothetical protein